MLSYSLQSVKAPACFEQHRFLDPPGLPPHRLSGPAAPHSPIARQWPRKADMRLTLLPLLFLLLPAAPAHAQGAVPTFRVTAGQATYTLAGRDPAQAATTTIPTLLVPVRLSFETKKVAGKPVVLDAAPDVASILPLPDLRQLRVPRPATHPIRRRSAARHLPRPPRLAHAPRQARSHARANRRSGRLRLRPHLRQIRPLPSHRRHRMAAARTLPPGSQTGRPPSSSP